MLLLLFWSEDSKQEQEQSFRWRGSLFFACAKKSNQKKAHPGGAPSALRATGPQAGWEFSEGTSMCLPKTTRILRVAPFGVVPILLAAPHGRSKSKKATAEARAEQQQEQQQEQQPSSAIVTDDSAIEFPLPMEPP
ncbi:hypothetical protein [Xanthomonas sp. 1678]|uniref:hypothetical protein n=1 Tax=Xanthomonas sp. 1678 TaxID=3158788 RepID=UPI002855103B|nr:hypothetical protein [Xanthomonas translucens]